MRDLLQRADLARYAGRFVWLELNFDLPKNRAFFSRYGANSTPTFYVIDPAGARVTATQTGAMSLHELERFLERGESGLSTNRQTSAEAALTRGDALLANHPGEAAKAYAEALRLAPASWPHRALAQASLVTALQDSRSWQDCAETAAATAAGTHRDAIFGRIVMTGMWCVVTADSAPWVAPAGNKLEPLAEEALSLSTTVRDHRDELYRTLMLLSLSRNDTASAGKWGDRWLAELDARKPAGDEERAAIDIARVENIEVYGNPERILPALRASERAMPHSYIASLRLAQMESKASHYDETVAACDRGLARSPGALGRSWLLQIKADALTQLGQAKAAHAALLASLEAARAIPNPASRASNIARLSKKLAEPAKQD